MGGQNSKKCSANRTVRNLDGNCSSSDQRKRCTCSVEDGEHFQEIVRRSTNPFLVFYMRLQSKKPNIKVTKMARIAGERWKYMTDRQKKKYVDIANAERKRRNKMIKKKRKRKSRKTRKYKR